MNATDFDMDFDDQDDEARYEPAHVHKWLVTISYPDSIYAFCAVGGCPAKLNDDEISTVLNRHVQPVPDPAGWGLGRKL